MNRKQLEYRLLVFLWIPALLILVVCLRRTAVCAEHHRAMLSAVNDSSSSLLLESAQKGDSKELSRAIEQQKSVHERLKRSSIDAQLWGCRYNALSGRIE